MRGAKKLIPSLRRLSSAANQNLGQFSLGVHPHAASMGSFRIPEYRNEPFYHYAPGSIERQELAVTCAEYRNACPEIPCVVGGKEIWTGNIGLHTMPTDHQHVLARWHKADAEVYKMAVENAIAVRPYWEAMPIEERVAIFTMAADRIATINRADINATTMLGIGKNVWQAEIDAVAETADFFRFGGKFAYDIFSRQSTSPHMGSWNRMEHRSLEGFVLALCPFNFLAIAANLAFSPAVMGNVVIWKPADTTILGCWTLYNILRECGLPDGVIQFVPGDAAASSDVTMTHPEFAGLHFTGSTQTFNLLWKKMAANLDTYRFYPRIVGETGGKNFHFVHESCDIESVVNHTIRSAYEYSGQKCSACSRMYVPTTIWPQIRDLLIEKMSKLKQGQPDDFSSFITSVIDKRSFDKVKGYIDRAKVNPKLKLLSGGGCDDSVGYFVQPTLFETSDPLAETMREEIFGPVLTVYPYEPSQFKETLVLCDKSSPYALCGAIFAQDRVASMYMANALRHTAGNFYINDKSTGSIVTQQPFGGGRKSGTNDKSGSVANLTRWINSRSMKENFFPQRSIHYPHEDFHE